ncbi:MAG: hypothetical protein FWE35_06775 [Streptosporangiales bacterium]|nr:hypothetical protein [Streptosporangiales bacterium]
MRITFRRFPDFANSYSLIERDDGVVYAMKEFTRPGTPMPHDLRHFVTERELGIGDGIWGGIAAGMVYGSMTHVRGRRPPRAPERPDQLKRTHRQRLMRAELLAGLIEAVARLDDPSEDGIRRLTRARLAAVTVAEPGQGPAVVAAVPSPGALARAARAMQVEAARWARLRPGQELVYEWPRPSGGRGGRSVPPQRAPERRHVV